MFRWLRRGRAPSTHRLDLEAGKPHLSATALRASGLRPHHRWLHVFRLEKKIEIGKDLMPVMCAMALMGSGRGNLPQCRDAPSYSICFCSELRSYNHKEKHERVGFGVVSLSNKMLND